MFHKSFKATANINTPITKVMIKRICNIVSSVLFICLIYLLLMWFAIKITIPATRRQTRYKKITSAGKIISPTPRVTKIPFPK